VLDRPFFIGKDITANLYFSSAKATADEKSGLIQLFAKDSQTPL